MTDKQLLINLFGFYPLETDESYKKAFSMLGFKPEQIPERSELHYSEQILNRLVDNFGFYKVDNLTAVKVVKNSGQNWELKIIFCERGRYAQSVIRGKLEFDIDCRDIPVIDAANIIMQKFNDYL